MAGIGAFEGRKLPLLGCKYNTMNINEQFKSVQIHSNPTVAIHNGFCGATASHGLVEDMSHLFLGDGQIRPILIPYPEGASRTFVSKVGRPGPGCQCVQSYRTWGGNLLEPKHATSPVVPHRPESERRVGTRFSPVYSEAYDPLTRNPKSPQASSPSGESCGTCTRGCLHRPWPPKWRLVCL